MKRRTGEREVVFREQQRRETSKVTAFLIEKGARSTNGTPTKGIKTQVLEEFGENGWIAAKRLFKQLNDGKYPDDLF